MDRIMLVDDDENTLKAVNRVLTMAEDFRNAMVIEMFNSPIKALRRAQECNFDLIISDYRMPMMDGVGFLAALGTLQPDAARIILSGCADRETVIAAINEAGVAHFLTKPWTEDDLTGAVRNVLSRRRLAQEHKRVADKVR
jgi:two-component system probable response regulator PhcQ